MIETKTLFVLAGGFGTRLRSVSKDTPKPLVEVSGKQFLVRVFQVWYNSGIRNFVFLLHYNVDKFYPVLDELASKYTDANIDFRVEHHPLGTGGAVLQEIKKNDYKNSVLISNADTWLDYIPKSIINNDKNVVLCGYSQNKDRFGQVRVNGEHVVSFQEKSIADHDLERKFLINLGFYNLVVDDLISLDVDSGEVSLEKVIFPKLIELKNLEVEIYGGYFMDIGVPDDFFAFEKFCVENQ